MTSIHGSSLTWAVVETRLIIVCITVGGWAVAMNVLHVTGLDNRAVAALGRLDWRCWAAHVHSGLVKLRQAETEGWREVPLLAGGQATHNLN